MENMGRFLERGVFVSYILQARVTFRINIWPVTENDSPYQPACSTAHTNPPA